MNASELAAALDQCRRDDVMAIAQQKLDAGIPAAEIVAECNQGMIELGTRFDQGDAFIPDLMFAGMIMKEVMAKLEPFLGASGNAEEIKKTLLIGTVQNDVHDIGKDITAMVFRSAGFRVIDLGVDVSPQKFVEAIREHKPDVVGMSLLLTTCYNSVTATMEAIHAAGLRDSVKICVGGAAASELMAERTGCDFYGKTAIDGLRWAMSVTA